MLEILEVMSPNLLSCVNFDETMKKEKNSFNIARIQILAEKLSGQMGIY